MKQFRMRYLLPSVCAFLLGCASAYRSLSPVTIDRSCIAKYVPLKIATSWYHASIEAGGKHFSGLVLIKSMPDSSHRIVFTSEAGLTFFDFGFGEPNEFKVYSIFKKLNRKPIVRTLRKDFELMLGIPFASGGILSWETPEETFFGVQQKKETVYFITDKDCSSLRRLERGTKRKRKISVLIAGKGYPLPDTLDIVHYAFPLEIRLTSFQKNESVR